MGKYWSKSTKCESEELQKIKIGVAGDSGVGKSSFINAFRGIDDDDEGAAETGICETTSEPTPYSFPGNLQIILMDLPGIGTPSFPNLDTYCDKITLETYDMFLILTATRFTQNDLVLAKKIKSLGKSFFLIRTKIDQDERNEKRKKRPHVESLLQKIRDHCYQNVKNLGIREDEIFLISNHETHRWDFERLVQAILEKLPTHLKETVPRNAEVSKEKTTVVTGAHNKENVDYDIEKILRGKLGGWKNVKIRFGVTGDSGTGKSAFINAIRGLNDDDEGAAKVDVIETTREPTEYYHPANPRICLVDLPGIGTPNYPDLPTYCKKVSLESYDKYLIFTASRFTKYDLELAKKVKSIKKSFFLIRTKIDDDYRAETRKRKFNEKEMLEKIKKYCFENVKDYISNENEIFLISNYDKEKWDFCRLIEAISDAQ